ncbi:DR2241 family protein [Haloferula chungangensis]|uniref:DR2241 family protein n=1 Tax=Haloferula chungangensis TaxID=1048331 RepID=A0ABW2L3Y6_9BACT
MIRQRLENALNEGIRQIGEITIHPDTAGAAYALCHTEDSNSLDLLETHRGPSAAREISTWAEDGHYRFTKGELSLRRGWLLLLDDTNELRQALDLFYPASLGLWLAEKDGKIDVQNLREKLNRQTGMYKFAKNISDAGAQRLVREVCGPGNCCVKKILWQIDESTALEDSEASRFNGIVGDPERAIPLLCREACNHFVAETRKASKAEQEAGK